MGIEIEVNLECDAESCSYSEQISLDPGESAERYIEGPISGWEYHPDDTDMLLCTSCADVIRAEEAEREEARR